MQCEYCQTDIPRKEDIEITHKATNETFFLCKPCYIDNLPWECNDYQVIVWAEENFF